MNIPAWTHPELEAKAEEFLQGYGRYDNRRLRIEETIEATGYKIWPVPGLGEIAEAYLPIKEGVIFIDEDQYRGIGGHRYVFSLAEELAHTILHRPLFSGMDVDKIRREQAALTDDEYLTIERQAKYLAACLLMRADWFRSRFARYQAIQKGRTGNQLHVLRYAIKQLGYDFAVSWHSVSIRAFYLGLIDQAQLDDLIESLAINTSGAN